MNPEEWIALIKDEGDRKYARAAVQEALESEREGEVVLAEGKMGEDMMMEATCNSIAENGKNGSVIFREDKGEMK